MRSDSHADDLRPPGPARRAFPCLAHTLSSHGRPTGRLCELKTESLTGYAASHALPARLACSSRTLQGWCGCNTERLLSADLSPIRLATPSERTPM